MVTMQLILSKYIMGYLLQSIICVLVVYTINKKKIEIKMFSIVTLLFLVSVAIIRALPTLWGVHTLICLIVLIILSVTLLKTHLFKTVLSALIVGIIILLTEFLNIAFLVLIIGFNNIENLFKNDLNKAIAGIPANILFFIVVLFIYKLNTKPKNEEKSNGEVDS